MSAMLVSGETNMAGDVMMSAAVTAIGVSSSLSAQDAMTA
jgi:hypothetical protein